MVYIPAILIIGFYFDKRRGLANGLAASGSGVGALIYSPLCHYLQQEYTWKGAVLILAAIALNTFVCATIFRPIELRHRVVTASHAAKGIAANGGAPTATGKSNSAMIYSEKDQHLQVPLNCVHVTELNANSHNSVDAYKPPPPHYGRFKFYSYFDAGLHNSTPKLMTSSERELREKPYNSAGNIGPRTPALSYEHAQHHVGVDSCCQPLRALERQDLFFSGSIKRIPDYGRLSTIDSSDDDDDIDDTSSYTAPSRKSSRMRLFRKSMYRVIGLHILTNPVFAGIVCYHLLWTSKTLSSASFIQSKFITK